MLSDPRGRARRAGAAGRAAGVRGRSQEESRRAQCVPLPARGHLHQAEEPRPGTHRLQLQAQHQGREERASLLRPVAPSRAQSELKRRLSTKKSKKKAHGSHSLSCFVTVTHGGKK